MEEQTFKQSKTPWIVLAIICFFVAGIVYFNYPKKLVVNNGYEAVFLSNGNVFFGKFTPATGYLTSVHYIQTVQNGSSTQPSLVKLGGELHQPLDEMTIEKNQILYYEELSSSSPISQAINQGK